MVGRGLAYWSAHLTGATSMDAEARAVALGHPRFEEACRLLVTKGFARYRSNHVFARANKDITRYFFAYFALYLDARGELTLTTIGDFVTELGLASPGRAAAILFRLRMIGYIERDKDQKDRRVRRYVPTEALKSMLRRIIRDELECLALMEPEAAIAAARLDEPDYFKAYALRAGQGLASIAQMENPNETRHFTARDSGAVILLDIATSGEPGDVYPPRGPVKMSVTELARKYEVSRSHVLKMLRDAENLGLLTRNADERTGVLSETLRSAVIDLHVSQLIGNAVCAHAAFEATKDASATGAAHTVSLAS